jgi:hypothetical protein
MRVEPDETEEEEQTHKVPLRPKSSGGGTQVAEKSKGGTALPERSVKRR